MELEKPLGLILEEVQENQPMGVKVGQISEGGSAHTSPYRDQILGCKIVQVMDVNVGNMMFDNVMDCIVNAPSPVKISFEQVQLPPPPTNEQEEEQVKSLEPGTVVEIRVQTSTSSSENPQILNAKVGDNLRKVLLENKVELYKGLKKKLGNCGGGGQCTFCAVDFVASEGWGERSDYENQKMRKLPSTARLACLNNIQGPATVRILD